VGWMTAAVFVALGARRVATAATAFFDSAIVGHFGLRAVIFGRTTIAGAGLGPARSTFTSPNDGRCNRSALSAAGP